jgi:hypothetical protein
MDVVKPALIKANAEMPTHCKQAPAVQQKRLSERAPFTGDATVRACGNENRKSQAETTWPVLQTVTTPYATIFTGQQAIAKAYSNAEGLGPTPRVIMSPIVDKLKRFLPISWYHLVAYGRFREAALRRVESASTIGANA